MLNFILQALFQSAQHLYEKREGSGSITLTNGSGSGRPNPAPDPQHWLPGQLRVWRGLVPHSQVVADHQVTRSANNTPDIDTFKQC